ncbi:hypothetical protein M409DRAFT_28740 [Zasmidium cellare ATCC 36951]|uniref:Uncharacterized protein n=1 Tax=Zasmidium cellare ATCC 36951 TaxID=1080233 RepID=A0A6A6C3V1_ZASCE|nr:uncharacterized protein M409DRAFT_28740 [Zasmidium cellare ATCC 36951]KAF2160860.1 hypothetical protein M409DRAFT_28740 [Zasmidium cellare ATCC 36951]
MTSNPHYGPETTGTEVAQRFSAEIKGSTVLITGISPNSLGETLALTIANHSPAHLILASRTGSKLQEVERKLKPSSETRITLLPLDLASQVSIRDAVERLERLITHIDVLINNAGVVSSTRQETAEGLELTFGTNHIGHFLLTSLLVPKLLASNSPRVVNVSSLGYKLSPFRFHDYNFLGKDVPPEELPPKGLPRSFTPSGEKGREYVTFCAYGQSKTANVLHVVGLRRRFGMRAYAVHPGTIWTDLPRSLSERDYKIIEGSPVWKNHDQGIATTLAAAFDPMLKDAREGVFLSDCQFEDVLPYAKDSELAERLWKLSESLVGGQSKL